jgi:hypothetical protein
VTLHWAHIYIISASKMRNLIFPRLDSSDRSVLFMHESFLMLRLNCVPHLYLLYWLSLQIISLIWSVFLLLIIKLVVIRILLTYICIHYLVFYIATILNRLILMNWATLVLPFRSVVRLRPLRILCLWRFVRSNQSKLKLIKALVF